MVVGPTAANLLLNLSASGKELLEAEPITEFINAELNDRKYLRVIHWRRSPDGDEAPLEKDDLILDFVGAIHLRDILNVIFPQPIPSRLEELRSMSYDEYLQSPEWKTRRISALHWAGDRCQLCNTSVKETQLHVHHRTYERRGLEHPSDLTVLCKTCHSRHHEVANPSSTDNAILF